MLNSLMTLLRRVLLLCFIVAKVDAAFVNSLATKFRFANSNRVLNPSQPRRWASNDATPDSSNDPSKESPPTSSSSDPINSSDSDLSAADLSFQNKVRVAKLEAEIDSLLQGPDAPFDLEGELKKVESVSNGLSINSEEYVVEQQVAQLESDLYAAVEQENYDNAASLQTDISQRHVDDCGAVLQVNSAFYKAFSEKSLQNMQKLWLQEKGVVCIHPSHKALVGYNAVLKSWKYMFETTNGSFQRNWMEPSNIQLMVKGTTAILTCDEDVFARRFVRGQRRQTERLNKLTATNIFRKVSDKWYMVHHHASWHAESEAAKSALNSSRSSSSGSRMVEASSTTSRLLNKRRSRTTMEDQRLASDGILGNFGPVLGAGDGDKKDGDGSKPVKRIVLGSLSDILNGGLGDILSNQNSSDEDSHDDNEGGKAIIQFHQVDLNGDDEQDLEMEEDEEEDDEEEEEEEEGQDTASIIQEWASSKGKESSDSSSLSRKVSSRKTSAPKDALRQSCISALRKLCDQGSISPKQKRVLLTDIISCSAKGEFSMVEVAYELLCGEGEDEDVAEEEFADQCRVFAHSLPESPPAIGDSEL